MGVNGLFVILEVVLGKALIARLRLWLTLIAGLGMVVARLWMAKCAYRLLMALNTVIRLGSNRFSSSKLIS